MKRACHVLAYFWGDIGEIAMRLCAKKNKILSCLRNQHDRDMNKRGPLS